MEDRPSNWFKVAVDYRLDDKWLKVNLNRSQLLQAEGLWFRIIAYCAENLTDGWVPKRVVEDWDRGGKIVNALVDANLLMIKLDGKGISCCVIPNYVRWQRSRADVVATRDQWRQKKRRQRAGERGSGERPGPSRPPECPPGSPPGTLLPDDSLSPGESRGESPRARMRTKNNRFGETYDDDLRLVDARDSEKTSSSSSGFSVDLMNPRCSRHAHLGPGEFNEERCGPCARAVRWANEQRQKDASREDERSRAIRLRREAIDLCTQCDEQGLAVGADGRLFKHHQLTDFESRANV